MSWLFLIYFAIVLTFAMIQAEKLQKNLIEDINKAEDSKLS